MSRLATPAVSPSSPARQRAERLAALRRRMAGLERAAPGAVAPAPIPLGLPALEAHLPGPGLACGALHEILPAAHGDRPAALGFAVALAACAEGARPGPAVLVAARRGFADLGRPYGHGLRQLGLDPARLLLVAAQTDQDALWALEEVLRAKAELALAIGALDGALDLTQSRRLSLAASASGTPLALLRPPIAAGTTAAATRWRIAAAPAAFDRFGAVARWRWRVALDRCRNGRPGRWDLEWDHASHRFRLAESVADRPVSRRPGEGGGGRDGLRLAV